MPTTAEHEIVVPLTVGKIESGAAIVLTDDLHMLEIPSTLLPNATVGTVLQIRITGASDLQLAREADFLTLQTAILREFGGRPDEERIEGCLKMIDNTHTTVTVGWPQWEELRGPSQATLKSIDAYVDGRKLPVMTTDETLLRLTGLTPGTRYNVILIFRTTAGRFTTTNLSVATASYEDFSCLRVHPDGLSDDATAALRQLGVQLVEFQGDKTAIVVTGRTRDELANGDDDGQLMRMADEFNVPVVTKEWVQACKEAGRMQSVSQFYCQ
jgi:hypothetical protein